MIRQDEDRQELMLPALIWRKKHAIGEMFHVVRPQRHEMVAKRGNVRVSPRIEQPLLELQSGERIVVTDRRHCPVPEGVDGVLYRQENGSLRWQFHRALNGDDDPSLWIAKRSEVSAAWGGGIRYASERMSENGEIICRGLRPPQIGALHAIGAHWSLYDTPATVVMPTGTGKTEIMIATLIGEVNGTLLVVVPSSALRAQTARKFSTLGLLRSLLVIPEEAPNPIVGVVKRRPRSVGELDMLESCHVVVSTMAAISQATALPLLPEMSARTGCLMVDEAHHVGATSWGVFRDQFAGRRVLQFTATPFRRDGIVVDGEVIYSYPLRRAQEDRYFRQITFDPVCEIDDLDADRAIAQKAVAQLQADLDKGLDHLVMARCNRIARAKAILELYEEIGARHRPILVHSDDPSSTGHLESLHNRTSRVVVCVEMLGEGFDLPHLKIAAIHDTHKSLAVLLQFAGRFSRTANSGIGDATVIANIADQDVSIGLERLYSEDADWNFLLAEMSSHAVREHRELIDFLRESVSLNAKEDGDATTSVSPTLLRPKFSTVVYKVSSFRPRRFHLAVPASVEVHRTWLHEGLSTLYYVTKSEPSVSWTRAKSIQDREWHLFVIHHDPGQGLLFIHSSDKSSLHDGLARAVGGQDAELIRGESVFRMLAGVNRLQFQNVGVTRHARRNLRYAMYTGADVRQALEASQTSGSTKSVLQGVGYENGLPVAIGCSYKGRVWSKEAGGIATLTHWFRSVGEKLVDDTISTNQIIENVLVPEEVHQFPEATVLSLDWPIEVLRQQEDRVSLVSADTKYPLSHFDLAFDAIADDRKAMKFHFEYDGVTADYVFRLGVANAFSFEHSRGAALSIEVSGRVTPLAEYLNDWPLLVRFADLSELDGNLLTKPGEARPLSFPEERFGVWDWDEVDVRKESIWRGGTERRDSIQARAAQHFVDAGYDIVFDDDGPGEAADLVCIKMDDSDIHFSLVHCKFSENLGGARLKDAVEVCSQAMRSGRWIWKFKELCRHMVRRERRVGSVDSRTRLLKGDIRDINNVLRASRLKQSHAQIMVVQPGISREGHSDRQATILAAAHCFLSDTVNVPLDVICAP